MESVWNIVDENEIESIQRGIVIARPFHNPRLTLGDIQSSNKPINLDVMDAESVLLYPPGIRKGL